MPTRQAFVVDMSERKEDLSNVIALNSSLMNFTRLIGPALAGIVVATWGEGTCFLLNSISFVAVIIALMAMKVTQQSQRHEGIKVFEHLRQGFTYVGSSMPIKFLLLTTALTSLAVVPYMVLMPVYAKTFFHGNAQTLGYMMGATSLGSLTGTLMLASRRSVLGLGRWLITSLAMLAASLLIFAFSHNLVLSFVALILGGFGMTTQMASSNTMLQTIVDDDKRGRVMSLYTMAFLGVSPLGGLLDGYLADNIGCTAIACGSGVLAAVLALTALVKLPTLRQHARPVYVERGIIPAPALETAQS
jgi:MFS family permease